MERTPLSRSARARLVFHGLIVVTLGLLAGFPWALEFARDPGGDFRAWRMAHLEGVLNGLLMMAVGAGGAVLTLSEREQRWLVFSFLVAGYGNVVASLLAAATGVRGMAFEGPLANLVVYFLFLAAVVGVLVGIGLALRGARTPIE